MVLTTIAAVALSQESSAFAIYGSNDIVYNAGMPAGIKFQEVYLAGEGEWIGLTNSGQVVGTHLSGFTNGTLILNQVPADLNFSTICGTFEAGAGILTDQTVFWWSETAPNLEIEVASSGRTQETFTSISSGNKYVLGVTTGGEIRYLGREDIVSELPDPPNGNQFVVARQGPSNSMAALSATGEIYFWGDNLPGNLSNPTSTGDWIDFQFSSSFSVTGINSGGQVQTIGTTGLQLPGTYVDFTCVSGNQRLIGLRNDGSIVESTNDGGSTLLPSGAVQKIFPTPFTGSGQPNIYTILGGENYPSMPETADPSNIAQIYNSADDGAKITLTEGVYILEEDSLNGRSKSLVGASISECKIFLPATSIGENPSFENCTVILGNNYSFEEEVHFINCKIESQTGEFSFIQGNPNLAATSLFYAENCSFSNFQAHVLESDGSGIFEGCTFDNALIYNGSGSIKLVNCDVSSQTELGQGSVITLSPSSQWVLHSFVDLTGTNIEGTFSYRGPFCRIDEPMYVKIRNANLRNFSSIFGGVIWADNAYLRIENCNFDSNNAFQGSDIFVQGGAQIDAENCTFINCYSTDNSDGGSCIRTENSLVSIKNCFFGYNEGLWSSLSSLIFCEDNYFCENNPEIDTPWVIDLGGNLNSDNCSDFDCNQNGIIDDEEVSNGQASDCNQNGIPDSCDLDTAFESDCNGNQIPDSCEIADGLLDDCDTDGVPDVCTILDSPSQDSNNDGILDRCQCITDINGDGFTDFSDVLQLLSCWGSDPTGVCGFADVSDDGLIDFSDVLLMLNDFGPC